MKHDIEDQLRSALRPLEPNDGFADRVMARIEAEQKAIPASRVVPIKRFRPALRWIPIALAASAVFGIAIVQQSREQDARRGLEARRQLLEALRVTSDKLDTAFQVVNDKSAAPSAENPGA